MSHRLDPRVAYVCMYPCTSSNHKKKLATMNVHCFRGYVRNKNLLKSRSADSVVSSIFLHIVQINRNILSPILWGPLVMYHSCHHNIPLLDILRRTRHPCSAPVDLLFHIRMPRPGTPMFASGLCKRIYPTRLCVNSQTIYILLLTNFEGC